MKRWERWEQKSESGLEQMRGEKMEGGGVDGVQDACGESVQRTIAGRA